MLVPTPAIRNLIREGKTHQIYSAIQTSGATGMQTMDAHLAQLVRQGKITRALAEQRASVPEELKRLLGRHCPHGTPGAVARRRRLAAGLATYGMSTFAFRAVDVAGIPSRGEVEAETKAQVTEQLRQRGLIVLDVSEKSEALKLESLLRPLPAASSMRELAVFSRQFATLIASGMPMLRALHTLEDQTENEMHPARDRRGAPGRRGRQLAGPGDGAPPEGLRQALPLDGALRRELGPPRGGARPDRLPAREARRAAPPDPLGDDVPGRSSSARWRSSC